MLRSHRQLAPLVFPVVACLAAAGCGSGSGGSSSSGPASTTASTKPPTGRYTGQTSQGKPVELVVTGGGATLKYFSIEANMTCSDGEKTQDTVPQAAPGSAPLTNGSFSGSYGEHGGDVYHVSGSYNGTTFTGTVEETGPTVVGSGKCTSGKLTWSASRSSSATTP